MLRNLIRISNGPEISSGAGAAYAIQSCTITESVNSGTELTLGSACCSCLEATILAPGGDLSLTAGDQITLCKVDDAGAETTVGTFLMEAPTRKSDNVYKITAYDLMTRLDKDMSQWLKEFTNWGCTLAEFAGALCVVCGLELKNVDFPNSTFPVPQFYRSGITGRQIMQWIAEIAGCFCRMDGAYVELAWYADSGVTVQATGDRYYFAGALSYEDYEVAAIDAVKLRLADSEDGALWPNGDADNPYIITGNAILMAQITEDLEPYLEVIQSQLAAMPKYKPCKVSLPVGLDIRAGHTVQIVDKKGNQFTTCVMTKTQSGQRDTLECTGSARRDSSAAVNNQTPAQIAQQAVDAQTHEDVFNKLTKNGTIQGIYVQDGKWYINAEQVVLQNLKVKAADITGVITVLDSDGDTLFSAGDNAVKIAGWKVDNNSFFSGTTFSSAQCFFCTGSNTAMSIGGSEKISGWMIKAGSNFGVTTAGAFYASDAYVQGRIVATSGSFTGTVKANAGKIGDWNIGERTIYQSSDVLYSGTAIYSDEYSEGDYTIRTTLTPEGVYVQWRNDSDSDVYYASWMNIVNYISGNT